MFEIKCTICDTVQELKLTLEDWFYYIQTKEIDIEPQVGGEIKIKCNCCGFFIEERNAPDEEEEEEKVVYDDNKPFVKVSPELLTQSFEDIKEKEEYFQTVGLHETVAQPIFDEATEHLRKRIEEDYKKREQQKQRAYPTLLDKPPSWE